MLPASRCRRQRQRQGVLARPDGTLANAGKSTAAKAQAADAWIAPRSAIVGIKPLCPVI